MNIATNILQSARFQAATATATVTGELQTYKSGVLGTLPGYISQRTISLNSTVGTTDNKTIADMLGYPIGTAVNGAVITFTTAVKIALGGNTDSNSPVLVAGTYRFGACSRNGAYELEKLYDTTVTTYGADSAVGVQKVEQRYATGIVSADGLIKSGAGFLHCFSLSQTSSSAVTAGVLTLFDNTAESGTVFWGPAYFSTAHVNPVTIMVNASFGTGLYVGYATLAGVTVTASYR